MLAQPARNLLLSDTYFTAVTVFSPFRSSADFEIFFFPHLFPGQIVASVSRCSRTPYRKQSTSRSLEPQSSFLEWAPVHIAGGVWWFSSQSCHGMSL